MTEHRELAAAFQEAYMAGIEEARTPVDIFLNFMDRWKGGYGDALFFVGPLNREIRGEYMIAATKHLIKTGKLEIASASAGELNPNVWRLEGLQGEEEKKLRIVVPDLFLASIERPLMTTAFYWHTFFPSLIHGIYCAYQEFL